MPSIDLKLSKAAAWYAKNGIPIFPLRARDKKPLTPHGFKDASADHAHVEAWWKQNPHANIGIPMGQPSGLLLLDLDFRNGGPEDRDEVIERYGAWDDTAEVITGSGRHVYFRFPGGPVPKQIARGIELKGEGGYSVAPPSIHPNGNEYTFDGMNPKQAFLHPADPPAWLLEASSPNGSRPEANSEQEDDKWPQGERNNRLASLAGKLRRDGLSVEAITAALLAENGLRCNPPLADAEVRKIAASIGRYSPPREKPAGSRPATVNLDALPPSLDLLNSVALFQGRIRFTSLRRRGSIIQAGFANGREARWNTATDLRTFARSQDVLLDATGFLIPTPSVRAIRRIWETVAQLIRTLADQDATNVEPPLKDEFEQVIRATWVRAGRPEACGKEAFFQRMRDCQNYRRDHAAEAPPKCCVWIGGVGEPSTHSCWIYQDALCSWLSTPVAKHKHYPWDDVRTALLLLDFEPRELHRSWKGEKVHVRVWKGPLDLLVDDDTVEESEL